MPTSVRVHYIRHGQSVWNDHQHTQRRRGVDEATIKKQGFEPQFTDAPLTGQGVRDALELREILESAWLPGLFGWYGRADDLGGVVRCVSEERGCAPPPKVFVSNLRRAITTAMVVLRPMIAPMTVLPNKWEPWLHVLPALQESCHYADCVPLPRGGGDLLHPALPSASEETFKAAGIRGLSLGLDGDDSKLVADVLRDEARHAYGVDTKLCRYLHLAYQYTLAMVPHFVYDDRRRLPDGALDAVVADPSLARTTLAPLASRLGTILAPLLESAAEAATGGRPDAEVVLVAHSRLLRELLFAFVRADQMRVQINRTHHPASHGRDSDETPAELHLDHDAATVHAACAALADERRSLSNCGVVTFDLELCKPPECERPTLTLRNCALGPNGRVVPRKGGGDALFVYAPPRGVLGLASAALAVVAVVAALSVLLLAAWKAAQRVRARPRSSAAETPTAGRATRSTRGRAKKEKEQ